LKTDIKLKFKYDKQSVLNYLLGPLELKK